MRSHQNMPGRHIMGDDTTITILLASWDNEMKTSRRNAELHWQTNLIQGHPAALNYFRLDWVSVGMLINSRPSYHGNLWVWRQIFTSILNKEETTDASNLCSNRARGWILSKPNVATVLPPLPVRLCQLFKPQTNTLFRSENLVRKLPEGSILQGAIKETNNSERRSWLTIRRKDTWTRDMLEICPMAWERKAECDCDN